MYAHRLSLGPVDLAFTDRFGGASGVPYDELNLGINTADDPDVVASNLATVVEDFAPGCLVADMKQVHGRHVSLVESLREPQERPTEGRRHETPIADGLVSRARDTVLVVRVADCVPVLLADADAGVVGVAHAGRQGVLLGVVSETVRQMQALGAGDIEAWIGPHVCGSCYEVPAEMRDEVVAVAPSSRATTRQGTPALDLGAAVTEQLATAGVVVHDLSRCTLESPDLYSYRRDGAEAGRFAGLIRLRP